MLKASRKEPTSRSARSPLMTASFIESQEIPLTDELLRRLREAGL
jgi:hypothetical protein